MFINLFNFRFLRNCREITKSNIKHGAFYESGYLPNEVTFLTKPLHTGQIYVCGVSREHSFEVFPVYSEKIPNEIPGNIPK